MALLKTIYIIWYRDILRFWRDRVRIFSSLGFPLMFLLIFSSGLNSNFIPLGPGFNFAQFMFPGVIGMTVLFTSIMSGASIVWDREFGFLKEVLVAPVSRGAVASGKILAGASIAMIQGTIMLFLSPLLGVTLTFELIIKLWPLMFLMAASLTGLGIFIASRMKSMEAFQMVMQMLTLPMLFLSGALFPISNLPTWLNFLVKVNPVTYAIDPIRQVVLQSTTVASATPQVVLSQGMPAPSFGLTLFNHPMGILEDVAVVTAFGLAMVGLAVWSFSIQD